MESEAVCTQASAVGVDSVHQTGASIALTLHCGRRAWVDWQFARVGLKASHLWRLSSLAPAPRGSELAADTLSDVCKAQMEHTAGSSLVCNATCHHGILWATSLLSVRLPILARLGALESSRELSAACMGTCHTCPTVHCPYTAALM